MSQQEINSVLTKAERNQIPLGFCHAKSQFVDFEKGFMIQEHLDDKHLYKISVSHEFITLSVSENEYGDGIIENYVLYRISYNKTTKQYSIPIVNLLSKEVFRALNKALTKYRPKRISVHMQGFASGDPITIKPKIVKMEIAKPIMQVVSGTGLAIQLALVLVPLGYWFTQIASVFYHWKTGVSSIPTQNDNHLNQGVIISEVEGVSHE